MNKKRAKFNFCFVTILLALAVVLCFVSFRLPASNNDFAGMFYAIDATGDIATGYSAVYEIESDDVTDEDISSTVEKMRSILLSQGFSNYNVYRMGDYIKAEVNSQDGASTLLGIIGDSKTFFISEKSNTEEKSGSDGKMIEADLGQYDIVGTDVKATSTMVYYDLDKQNNGIKIEFTKSGAEKLKKLSERVVALSGNSTGDIYFYIGGEYQTSLSISQSSQDYLSFYSASYSEENAKAFALQILMSSTGVNLKTVSISESNPILGVDVLIKSMIALLVVLVAILVLLPVLFGDLGFVADLSVLIGCVIAVFLFQALPLTTMSIAGILGAMFGLILMAFCHVLYLNKMKSEFKVLKRLQLSAKTAFKKSWLKILDLSVITFIFGLVLAFWQVPYITTFGIALATLSFVSLFNIVIIFKDFVAWYVTINSKDYKRVKFTKGEDNE